MPDPYQWEIWEATWAHEDGTAKPRYEFNASDPAFRKTGITATCYLYLQEAREIDKDLLLYKRGQLGTMAALMIGFTIKGLFKPPLP